MAITSLTLTNPGAESGSMTGWTVSGGFNVASITSVNSVTPHTGSRFFTLGISSGTVSIFQTIDVSSFSAAIDGNTGGAKVSAWQINDGDVNDLASLFITCFAADGTTKLYTEKTTAVHPTVWTAKSIIIAVPIGTRFIRIGATTTTGDFTGPHSYWDDFALEISNAATTDYPTTAEIQQVATYALVSQPAQKLQAEQVPVLATVSAEASSGLFLMKTNQVVAYALVKKNGDRSTLRAWTFPQDEHKFYVLQLGNSNGTLVYDTLSQRWSSWTSPDQVFWRGEDGCAWEGFNVTCDTLSGKIFQIDAEGRLDWNDSTEIDDTPITSVVVGGSTERMRKMVPCYLAELAISEGSPPVGIDPTTVGISLRSHDTITTYDHGTVDGSSADKVTIRWYGLGLMGYPGRVFEITDTGYARRIDGFNIELGGQGG